MSRWNNDYNHGAHPAVLEAFIKTNQESYGGYGLDEWCERAAEKIKTHLGSTDADIHFMVGGTQVNYTVIAAALRPYQGVISATAFRFLLLQHGSCVLYAPPPLSRGRGYVRCPH